MVVTPEFTMPDPVWVRDYKTGDWTVRLAVDVRISDFTLYAAQRSEFEAIVDMALQRAKYQLVDYVRQQGLIR